MKLIVPVYDTQQVNRVCKAAEAGGHIAAICNPDSGPGGAAGVFTEWRENISRLRKAGAQVLYYVDLVLQPGDHGNKLKKPRPKSLDELKTEMDIYIARYEHPLGWFFDDLADFTKANAEILEAVVLHRGGYNIANPGNADGKSTEKYLDTGVNVLVTWERDDYATKCKPKKWELDNSPRIGVMALKAADYRPALDLARKRNVNLFYATTAPDTAKAYDKLPSYFAKMAKDVSEGPELTS